MSVPGERAAAKALGLTRYFTGRPCKYGHTAERRTSTSGCVVCVLAAQREYDAKNREERRRKNRDGKRAKRRNFEAPAEHREIETPKSISLAAYQGVDSKVLASRWINEQAARLHVSAEIIIGAIRLRWTLVEVEQLPRGDAHQLRDNVNKHKKGEGVVRSDGYLHTNTGEVE